MKRNSNMNPSSGSPRSKSGSHECRNGSKWTLNNVVLPGLVACKYITSPHDLTLDPSGDLTEIDTERRFLDFDRSVAKANIVCSPESPPLQNLNQKPRASGGLCVNFLVNKSTTNDLMESNKTSSSDTNEGYEMHEDTDEIDALLYSGSEDEQETSTDHSPDKTLVSEEEVASSTVPTKRKRRIDEIDADLTDTASSEARFHHCQNTGNDVTYNVINHGCVKIVGHEREISFTTSTNKRLKRERIHETMHVLRRIIPGGGAKDTIALLDKAIRYLRFLKAQTKK